MVEMVEDDKTYDCFKTVDTKTTCLHCRQLMNGFR